jgi:hypothetical protein
VERSREAIICFFGLAWREWISSHLLRNRTKVTLENYLPSYIFHDIFGTTNYNRKILRDQFSELGFLFGNDTWWKIYFKEKIGYFELNWVHFIFDGIKFKMIVAYELYNVHGVPQSAPSSKGKKFFFFF